VAAAQQAALLLSHLIFYIIATVVGTVLLQFLILLKEYTVDTKSLAIQITGNTIAHKQHLVLQALAPDHVQILFNHTAAFTVHVGG
jgi:hypothetical protein